MLSWLSIRRTKITLKKNWYIDIDHDSSICLTKKDNKTIRLIMIKKKYIYKKKVQPPPPPSPPPPPPAEVLCILLYAILMWSLELLYLSVWVVASQNRRRDRRRRSRIRRRRSSLSSVCQYIFLAPCFLLHACHFSV